MSFRLQEVSLSGAALFLEFTGSGLVLLVCLWRHMGLGCKNMVA